jgi:hypothetical protein
MFLRGMQAKDNITDTDNSSTAISLKTPSTSLKTLGRKFLKYIANSMSFLKIMTKF